MLVVSAVIYVVCVGVFAYWYAREAEQSILKNVDDRLMAAAAALPQMLAPDFHDRALGKDSISYSEELENRKRFNAYAHDTGLTWLYTVVESGGAYYFTAPTVSPEEAAETKRWYFYPYEKIPQAFVRALNRGDPVFLTYSDEWGTFRSVALPRLSPRGRAYLSCADLEVPMLASLVHKKRLEAMAYGVLFILFSVPFIISHHSLYTRYAKQLRQMNRELMTHRDHLERMVQLRTSELMTAKDRAEEAERAKGRFLAVMSHEIRTPLNTILGMCEVLSASGLAPYQKRRLSSITEAGGHLVELINDILDITRLDSMQTELELRPFMLPALLESAGQVARSATHEESRGLRFDIEIPKGVETCRLGDPTRLKQVLVNLLSNAFKFTREGRVTLAVSKRTGDDLLFIVRDTGIGIPTGRLRHIFDEYTQVDASTSREFGGTGLGLAICRRLAKVMNGALWAESTEGEGSAFFFRVPLPVTEPEAPVEMDVPPLAGGTEGAAAVPAVRVLVAEDMAANYEIVRLFMEPTPAEPERAANGLQAVEMALTGRYAMVLMDLQMPEMDGIDAVATLREREREQGLERTPVVALTANVLPSRRRQALDAGCDEVLTKPLLSAALYRAIIHYARVTPATALAQSAAREAPREEPGPDGPLLVLVDELDEEITAMGRMLDQGDLAYVARVAHGLKGAAQSYGLEPLARALAALEAAAEAGDAQAAGEAMGPLAEARAALN